VAGTLAAGMVVGAGVIVTRSPAPGKENRTGQEEQQGGHSEVQPRKHCV
jgi:hypothetical protein